MVEGPGATRNARKLQPCVGATISTCCNFEALIGEQVVEAFCVGKQVFIVLSNDSTLRLHFGMNGCLWLTQESNNATPMTKNPGEITLSMTLSSHPDNLDWILTCRGTSVTIVTARVALSRRDRLRKLNVCSDDGDDFDAASVMEILVTRRPTALIADAILDQDCFPGVGNIIKVEGLHRARVHPKRIVSSLTEQELRMVVSECRLYAQKWLQSGRAPTKLVCNQSTCQTCGHGRVQMAKIGNDLSRTTFWCVTCQPLSSPPPSTTSTTTTSVGQKRTTTPLRLLHAPPPAKKIAHPRPRTLNPVGVCPKHGSRSIHLKRVRKVGRNQHRIFYSCRSKSCSYFAWADSHFDTCCGRKVLLRVSKTERSGGRWFTSCVTCSRFAWATPQQLEPIQEHLTPLL